MGMRKALFFSLVALPSLILCVLKLCYLCNAVNPERKCPKIISLFLLSHPEALDLPFTLRPPSPSPLVQCGRG